MVAKAIDADSGEQNKSLQETVGTTETVGRKGRTAGKRGKKRARSLDSDQEIEDDVQMMEQPPSGRSRVSRHKIRKVYNPTEGMDESESDDSEQENDSAYVPGYGEDENDAEVPSSLAVKTEEADIRLPPPSVLDSFPINVDEEDKPKLAMRLSYSGHYIPGRYLCVIVEPYPPLSSEQIPAAEPILPPEVRFRPPPTIPRLRDPNEVLSSSRAGSARLRSETPLFLPDDDDDDRSIQGHSPARGRDRLFPPVPRFDGSQKERLLVSSEENASGLLAFSQALTNVRHEEQGDDSGEDYLRGDADEEQRILE